VTGLIESGESQRRRWRGIWVCPGWRFTAAWSRCRCQPSQASSGWRS